MKGNKLPLGPKGVRNSDLTTKANNVVMDLTSSGKVRSTDLRAFQKKLLTRNSACSIQSLNGFVHNPYDLPTADALRAGWEATLPLLIAVYGSA